MKSSPPPSHGAGGSLPLELQPSAEGIGIAVHVQPAARRSAVLGCYAGGLKISVTAAPERGQATAAVVCLLAEILGVPRGHVRLISGQTSRRKKFLVCGLTPADLHARIASALATDSTHQ